MERIRSLSTDSYDFVARYCTDYDNCQRGTGNNGKVRTERTRLRCGIALRVAVAEFVGGPVTVLHKTP